MNKTMQLSQSMPLFIKQLSTFNKQNLNKKQAFIKINDIKLPNINTTKVVAYVGSRKIFNNGYFNCSKAQSKVWNFTYSNKNQSSFVIALYNQQSMFSKGELLGEIEIKLSSFKSNSITKHSFLLRSSNRNSEPISVSISVHLNEDGSKPFISPESNILNYEYEVINKKFYLSSKSFQNIAI